MTESAWLSLLDSQSITITRCGRSVAVIQSLWRLHIPSKDIVPCYGAQPISEQSPQNEMSTQSANMSNRAAEESLTKEEQRLRFMLLLAQASSFLAQINIQTYHHKLKTKQTIGLLCLSDTDVSMVIFDDIDLKNWHLSG